MLPRLIFLYFPLRGKLGLGTGNGGAIRESTGGILAFIGETKGFPQERRKACGLA